MINQVVSEYLDRFAGTYTESLYNAKGYEDYNYMRRCCDYLECDKLTLTQPRNTPAGLRNIGNTCYLNTILQLLFHINFLREKISASDHLSPKLIKKLQFLFGVMSVGKMPFADPSEVFEELRASNPDVFVPGVQNDFHEVFTLLLEAISESYKTTTPEDSRHIKKLLFGKMVTKIDYGEGKMNDNAEFNIINLNAETGHFGKALERWRKYQISDFTTPNGKTVAAQAENVFLQTPALMVFFINRVSYRQGKLQKNCTPFQFDESILVAKAFQSDKTIQVKTSPLEKQKQFNEEKNNLLNWLKKTQSYIQHLEHTINYLQAKDAPLLSEPAVMNTYKQVDNPMGEEGRIKALSYLQEEKTAIERRVENVGKQIQQIDQKLNDLCQEENCERYVLWGVMVHQGTSAVFGHYKLCLLLAEQWYEFNDKQVSLSSSAAVEAYRDKGEICCLFYRRPELICTSKKTAIPFSLKNSVTQFQRQFRKDIDKSRILQILYQQTQSISLLMEYEMKLSNEDKFQYFFKPLHYALSQNYNYDTCKGILLQEQLHTPQFLQSVKDKLIDPSDQFELSMKTFGIPNNYFQIKKTLEHFLDLQVNPYQIGQAYDYLSHQALTIKNEKGSLILKQMREAIILKGLYYLKLLSECDCLDASQLVVGLSEGLDRLLREQEEGEFTLVCISIKASIQLFQGHKKLTLIPYLGQPVHSYPEYFTEQFKFWLAQRNSISKIDEINFMDNTPPCPKFKIE